MLESIIEVATGTFLGLALGVGIGRKRKAPPERLAPAALPAPASLPTAPPSGTPESPQTDDVIADLAAKLQESWLEEEAEDKVRMESELGSARVVQEMLLPTPRATIGNLELAGATRALSECSGDWWGYTVIEDRLWICISDAIGHGVAAALLTSAANSAFSLIKELLATSNIEDSQQVARSMQFLNAAIYNTSKGAMPMTSFLACIDLKGNRLQYVNANHCVPVILSGGNQARLLRDANFESLGTRSELRFIGAETEFNEGDCLLLYTDGAVEQENPNGKPWRLKGLLDALKASAGTHAADVVTTLREAGMAFSAGRPPDDDWTVVACVRKKTAESTGT